MPATPSTTFLSPTGQTLNANGQPADEAKPGQPAASEFAGEPHPGHAGPVSDPAELPGDVSPALSAEAVQVAEEMSEQAAQDAAQAEAEPAARVASKSARRGK